MTSTIDEWSDKSKKGEVCGVLDCGEKPLPCVGYVLGIIGIRTYEIICTSYQIKKQKNGERRLKA
jgi:hypothetical protein